MAELNALLSIEEHLDAVQIWNLDLYWPARTAVERVAAMAGLHTALEARSVVAAFQTGVEVPLGLRVALAVAVSGDRVVVHTEDESLSAGLDPDHLMAALHQHAGAWVVEPEEDGFSLLAGESEAFESAAREAARRELGAEWLASASDETALEAGLLPVSRAAVHHGDPDPELWSVVAKATGDAITLHRDVAVLRHDGAGDPDAPFAELGVLSADATGRPALSLRDYGTWWTLSYYSRDDMSARVKTGQLREPSLRVSVGLGATTLPGADAPSVVLPVPDAARSGDASGSPERRWAPGESTPARRLAHTLASLTFTLSPEDADSLREGMSAVRAEQAIASLARCVPDGELARVPVAKAPWLKELADAVEMLGFDPAWVGVLAGTARAPEGGEAVRPRGVMGAVAGAMARELRGGRGRPEKDGAGDGTGGDRATSGTGEGRRPVANENDPRYIAAIVELLLAAALLFLHPLPWTWVNYAAGAVLTLHGAWLVWRAARPR